MDKTIEFFKKLSKIPRPSGKEEKVAQFLINFAKEHNLEYFTDNTYNVIIKKPSNQPNCNRTLILQAHTDMVCEKNAGVNINFDKDSITLDENDDFIFAKGTTLGADNGIGLSMILSILDDENLKIPNIEAVFTAQEETTMQGAIDLDFTLLKGEHLLSIDGTDEGKIEVSSAGMAVVKNAKTFERENANSKLCYKISILGLQGGHSGTEINSNRLNAIKLLFKFLNKYKQNINFVSIIGGGKSNAIPRECVCEVIFNKVDTTSLQEELNTFCCNYLENEPNICGKIEPNTKFIPNVLSLKDSENLIDFVNNHNNGVLVWSDLNPNFPIVSNNFANIQLNKEKLEVIISLRSSVKKLESEHLSNLFSLAEKHGLSFDVLSTAPFFERKQNSYLQELCCKNYEKLFNEKAVLNDVHAGLEGGVFAGKRQNLDICVIAPNIYDAHSPKERVSKTSITKTYKWLESIVESF